MLKYANINRKKNMSFFIDFINNFLDLSINMTNDKEHISISVYDNSSFINFVQKKNKMDTCEPSRKTARNYEILKSNYSLPDIPMVCLQPLDKIKRLQ